MTIAELEQIADRQATRRMESDWDLAEAPCRSGDRVYVDIAGDDVEGLATRVWRSPSFGLQVDVMFDDGEEEVYGADIVHALEV